MRKLQKDRLENITGLLKTMRYMTCGVIVDKKSTKEEINVAIEISKSAGLFLERLNLFENQPIV